MQIYRHLAIYASVLTKKCRQTALFIHHLNNYLTGRRKAIDVSLVESIVSSFDNVSAEWLLTGKGKMFKSENKPYDNIPTRPRIPMSAAAGAAGGFAGSIHNVSRMLGHTNLKQTLKYAEILEKDVRSDYDMIADKLK